jgi:hypothetical protein
MTTPTINETSAAFMPGVYELLLDEDTTIGAGNDSEEMVLHITHAGMAPVTRTIELYRPKITAGNTLGVASDGDISGNVDGAVASVTGAVGSVTGAVGSVTAAVTLPTIPTDWITAAGINTGAFTADAFAANALAAGTFAANSLNGKGDWNIGKTGYTLTQTFPTNFADLSITATTGLVDLNDKTGFSISGFKTTLDALNDVSTAEVNTEVDNAIVTYHLDHLFFADYDPAAKPGVATALLNELVENDAGESRFTVNALENAPSGSGASADTIAAAVWDKTRSAHVAVGSFGETMGTLESNIDNLDAPISTVDTVVDGIKAVTDLIPDSGAMTSIATAAALTTVDTVVDALTTTIGTAGAGLTDLGGMSTTMKGQVNTEVVDVVFADTDPELTTVPAANAPIGDKINFVYMLARNKVTQTATAQNLYRDDGTTAVGSGATVSDDTFTFTRDKFS